MLDPARRSPKVRAPNAQASRSELIVTVHGGYTLTADTDAEHRLEDEAAGFGPGAARLCAGALGAVPLTENTHVWLDALLPENHVAPAAFVARAIAARGRGTCQRL